MLEKMGEMMAKKQTAFRLPEEALQKLDELKSLNGSESRTAEVVRAIDMAHFYHSIKRRELYGEK